MSTLAFSLESVTPPRPDTFIPLYIQIAEQIAQVIRSQGTLAIGKILPSEIDWMKHLGVSRPTVRQAMAHLCMQGLITRHKGRGTFVADAALEQDIGKVFEDEIRSSSRQVSFKLVEWKLIAMPKELTEIFQEEQVYRLVRVRSVDRKIVGLEERHLPVGIGDRLASRDLKTRSLLELVGSLVGQRHAQMHITVSSEGATKDQAALLEVKAGTPLLVRKNTFYFNSDRPTLHSVTRFIAKNYQFHFRAKLDLPPP